jgi:ParB family chromosome partitioning protein
MTTATAGNVSGQAGDKDHNKEKLEKRRALGRGLASLLPGPRAVAPVAPASGAPAPIHTAPAHAPVDQRIKGDIRAVVDESVEGSSAGAAGQPGAAVSTLSAASSFHTSSSPSSFPASVSPAAPSNTSSAAPGAESGAPIELMAQAESRIPGNLVINLAITDIDKNPFQTRYVDDNDALEELADSIKANGVVQPIVVRPSDEEDGRYILVLGERRLHASKKAGKTHIPTLVRKVSLQQAAEMTIVENLQREDLSPLEQAEAFRVLSNQFQLTQQQIAERVGLSRVSVANYMRLLKLPVEVMQLLAEKKINFAKAKELLKLGDNDRIAEAALYAVKKGMNIEQIEMLVLRMDGMLDPLPDMPGVEKRKSSGARWVDPNVRAAQVDLERMLGVRVRIRDRKGKGKIVIEYSTVDDYERVVEMLRAKK